jgi:uncharacterized caspase-like protein
VNVFSRIIASHNFNKSYALIIGIGNYDNYNDLDSPVNDALRVRDFLKQDGFDEIITITDSKVTIDRLNNLMEEVFPEKLTKNDRFLFYFSGHTETRILSSDEKRGYLVLKPARKKNWSQMVDMPRLRQWSMNVLGARHTLFILDACFGGLAGFDPDFYPQSQNIERMFQPAHQLVTAAEEDEQSYAVDGRGIFTDAFLQAVSGEGDSDNNGVVSLSEAIIKVISIIDLRRSELSDRIIMSPRIWRTRQGEDDGEFFFNVRSQFRQGIERNITRPNSDPNAPPARF